MDFPIYKKYLDEKSFFEIINPNEFIELKITGKTYTLHRIKAKILPERVLINDMLTKDEFWLPCSKEEFFHKMEFCQYYLKELP